MRRLLWLVATSALVAGCLQGPAPTAGASEMAVLQVAVLATDPASPLNPSHSDPGGATPPIGFMPPLAAVADGPAVLVPGKLLRWNGTCPCDLMAFTLDVGSRWDGWLDLRVAWDGSKVPDLQASMFGADWQTGHGQRGFDDRVVRLWRPVSGLTQIRVTGSGAYEATVRLAGLDVPTDGDLRPNLAEETIEGPHVAPCDEVETVEQHAVKCMRFGNGVANPGHGPMQIRLTLEEGAGALSTLGGHFVQEVLQADGSVHEHTVGPATFHPTHGHWHYDGFATFELYQVDPATGLRGALASSHHKSGFCFLDWDKMRENITQPADKQRAETDCLVPGLEAALSGSTQPPAWTNGISRGWYDFYEQQLTDQYVDIDGLPAGTYELVATADPQHTLSELDETDNQSSLLLHIDGDAIDVLEERAHYHVQDADDH